MGHMTDWSEEVSCQLPPPDRCCGCSACFAACPHGAIEMRPDEEGFLNPVVKNDVCVGCGMCVRACPVLHPRKPRRPLAVFAAKAKDDGLRRISSSGGMFSLLARDVLSKGGIVYGAAFESNAHKVVHVAVEDEDGLDKLRGSKYVQSDMGDVFRHVKRSLELGRHVLFSGCPCQVAGLNNFLGTKPDTLLLVDVICHAVPSPLAWSRYLSCREKKANARIARVFSRRNCPWRKYSLSMEFLDAGGKTYAGSSAADPYLRAFVSELFNRKSCHQCRFRCFASGSDLTIGDFWGIEKSFPDFNDDIGVSAVLCCTEKGKIAFSGISDSIVGRASDVDSVARMNMTLIGNRKASRKRQRFFDEVTAGNFDELVERLMMPPLWYRFLRWIKWHTIGRPA